MDKIYLDSCIVIYLAEHHPVFAPILTSRIAALENTELCISPLVRLEVLVKPMRDANQDLLTHYDKLLARLNHLTITEEVYEIALSLRARQALKTPDALHIATARFHHCQQFWTNDERLATQTGIFAVNITKAI
jgi:uncharacterized protein